MGDVVQLIRFLHETPAISLLLLLLFLTVGRGMQAHDSREVAILARSCLVWFWFCGWTKDACIRWWGESSRKVFVSEFWITLLTWFVKEVLFLTFILTVFSCAWSNSTNMVRLEDASETNRWLGLRRKHRVLFHLPDHRFDAMSKSSGSWRRSWIRLAFGGNELGTLANVVICVNYSNMVNAPWCYYVILFGILVI